MAAVWKLDEVQRASGFGVKYPWTEDAKAYVEYKASVETSIFNVIGVNFFFRVS